MTWQKARVLPGNPALPAGTELWVTGDPEPVRGEVADLKTRAPEWHPPAPDPTERLLRTHLWLPWGAPLYTRLSQVELIADFRDEVDGVDVRDLAGFDASALFVERTVPE